MKIGNAISALKHTMAEHPRATKVIGTAAGAAGLIGVVSACTSKAPPTDASTVASSRYHEFDKNADGSIAPDEATIKMQKTWTDEDMWTRTYIGNGNYLEVGTTKIMQQDYERSIDKIRSAAAGADAIASWKEIGDFAVKNFDTPDKNGRKDGMLDGKEQKAFGKAYGEEQRNVGNQQVLSSSPFVRTYHDPYYEPPRYDDGYGSNVDPGPIYDRGSDVDPGPVYHGGSDVDEGPGYYP